MYLLQIIFHGIYYSFLRKDSLPLKDTSFNTVANNFKTVEKTAP